MASVKQKYAKDEDKNIFSPITSINSIYNTDGKTLIDTIYPVGSIFLSTSSTNPSTYLGGTWSLISQGRTLVGVDTNDIDFNTVKKIGGEKTHKLTINEMPKHVHKTKLHFNVVRQGFTFGDGGTYNCSLQTGDNLNDTTDYTGTDQAHNNLQPYYTCYIWLRTK